MQISRQHPIPVTTLIQTACTLALAADALSASAGEGYKLRQSPVGLFGGEMAAPADNPGFFGTAALTYSRIYKVVDDAGNNIVLAPRTIPLPTGVPTAGRVPNGTFTLNVPAGTIGFSQNQTQLNLLGGYLAATAGSKRTLGGGVVVWSTFTVLTPASALSGSLPLLLGTRCLMGCGEGTAFPSIQQVIKGWVPPGSRSRALRCMPRVQDVAPQVAAAVGIAWAEGDRCCE